MLVAATKVSGHELKDHPVIALLPIWGYEIWEIDTFCASIVPGAQHRSARFAASDLLEGKADSIDVGIF
jgi:hypothetical protein